MCIQPYRSMSISYLIIRDDGSSEITTIDRDEVVNIRNKDPSVVRIRKMNSTTVDKCNRCRESHVLEGETPDCRLCRGLWADRTMSGNRVSRLMDRGSGGTGKVKVVSKDRFEWESGSNQQHHYCSSN